MLPVFINIREIMMPELHTHTHGIVLRVFASGPGDRGSIPDRVIPKTSKMVVDAFLINTQPDKIRSRVSGAIQAKKQCPLLYLNEVVIY